MTSTLTPEQRERLDQFCRNEGEDWGMAAKDVEAIRAALLTIDAQAAELADLRAELEIRHENRGRVVAAESRAETAEHALERVRTALGHVRLAVEENGHGEDCCEEDDWCECGRDSLLAMIRAALAPEKPEGTS